jgi:RNA polymerase sigma-70 factor (sigma-E family)
MSEAEDLAQEAMVRTYRAWRRIRDREQPAGYARTVLLNYHRSLIRRAGVRAKNLVRTVEQPDRTSDPSETVAMWQALMTLPARQREAIVLHYYEDLPQNEIATIMRCPPGTVNSLVHRGLARLRAQLDDTPDEMVAGSEA